MEINEIIRINNFLNELIIEIENQSKKTNNDDIDLILCSLMNEANCLCNDILYVNNKKFNISNKSLLRELSEIMFYIDYILLDDNKVKEKCLYYEYCTILDEIDFFNLVLGYNINNYNLINNIPSIKKVNDNKEIKKIYDAERNHYKNLLKDKKFSIINISKTKKLNWYTYTDSNIRNIRDLSKKINKENFYVIFYKNNCRQTHGMNTIKNYINGN